MSCDFCENFNASPFEDPSIIQEMFSMNCEDLNLCLNCKKELNSFHEFFLKAKSSLVKLLSVKDEKFEVKQESDYDDVEPEVIVEELTTTTTVKKEDYLTCETCGKTLKATSMRKHRSRHRKAAAAGIREIRVGPDMYTCDLCQKTFKIYNNMKQHIVCKHLNARNFICNICGVSLKAKDTLQRHILFIHQKQGKDKCPICGRLVKDLKKHTWDNHDPKSSLVCSHCGRSYGNKKSLWHHVKMHHLGGRTKHKCTHCDKGFKNPMLLREHMQIHLGGFLYSCEFCSFQANFKRNLRTHVKRQHPAEWLVQRQEYLKSNFDLNMLSSHTQNPAAALPNIKIPGEVGSIEVMREAY